MSPSASPSQSAAGDDTSAKGLGPVGSGDRTLRAGECILSVAFEAGHFWETIWTDPANAELKEIRKEPQKVLPGDRVTVMDLRIKELSRAVDQKHRFRRKGVPAQLRLRFLIEEAEDDDTPEGKAADPDALHTSSEDPDPPTPPEPKPRADVPYRLTIDGVTTEGATDSDGIVQIAIPPNARSGELILEPGTPQQTVVPLKLGHLDPIEELSGVKQRLMNLGYPAGEQSPEPTPELSEAIEAFQAAHGLEATGQLDDKTRSSIQQVHGE